MLSSCLIIQSFFYQMYVSFSRFLHLFHQPSGLAFCVWKPAMGSLCSFLSPWRFLLILFIAHMLQTWTSFRDPYCSAIVNAIIGIIPETTSGRFVRTSWGYYQAGKSVVKTYIKVFYPTCSWSFGETGGICFLEKDLYHVRGKSIDGSKDIYDSAPLSLGNDEDILVCCLFGLID